MNIQKEGEGIVILLITLNSRLATAAAAMSPRMVTRSKPRVLPELAPLGTGSIAALAMLA